MRKWQRRAFRILTVVMMFTMAWQGWMFASEESPDDDVWQMTIREAALKYEILKMTGTESETETETETETGTEEEAGTEIVTEAETGTESVAETETETEAETETETETETEPEPLLAASSVAETAYALDMLEKYSMNDSVRQIVLVDCAPDGSAAARFYVKDANVTGIWKLVFENEAFIGWNGTGKETEGDGKTPLGDYGIRQAFGLKENPGTDLEYIKITEYTACCSDNCEYYNQIIDKKETGHLCSGGMIRHVPEFNYGVATNYNEKNEWPKGSGIFLHCKGDKPYTAGCIAIDEDKMKTVLEYADPGMRIIIYEDQPEPETEQPGADFETGAEQELEQTGTDVEIEADY